LRPRSAEPVRQVFALAAGLTPADVARLHVTLLRQVSGPSEIVWTPKSVARAMVGLLADEAVASGTTIYDPFVRFGELPTEFLRTHPNPTMVDVRAAHSRSAELRLAGMRLLIAGARPDLALTSSMAPPAGADVVLANPPFGRQNELAWLRHCIDSLAPNGRAGVLMPYRTGFDQSITARNFRRELVEQGQVRAVVALPAQMFPTTRIGVCVWLLRRPAGQPLPVRFVDARELGQMAGRQVVFKPGAITAIVDAVDDAEHELGVTVLPDVIRAHGYSLHPPEYSRAEASTSSTRRAAAELANLVSTAVSPHYRAGTDDGWPRRRLDELCEIRTGVPHRTLTSAYGRARDRGSGVAVVHPRHLRHGLIDIGGAPLADPSRLDRYRLREGDVLCVRTGAMGQVAIVRLSEAGLLPHTNVRRLRVVDQAVLDAAYLSAYLRQPSVQDHIRDRSVRSVTTSISVAELGGIEMPVPPLGEQHRILHTLEAFEEQISDLEQQLTAVRCARVAFGKHLTDGTIIVDERLTS
jgi:type I restriction enzyme M protein